MSPGPGLISGALLALLLLSALFSAARAALSHVPRTKLGDVQKRALAALPVAQMLAAALAGAVALTLISGWTAPEMAFAALGLAALFAVFGQFLPARYGTAREVLHLLGVNGSQETHTVHEDLKETIDQHIKGGTVVKNDRDMLSGILAMQDLEVADIMVHRTKMRTFDVDMPVGDLLKAVIASPFTRHPLWRGDPDDIVGVLHSKELMRAVDRAGGDPARICVETLMTPPWFVPDTTLAAD